MSVSVCLCLVGTGPWLVEFKLLDYPWPQVEKQVLEMETRASVTGLGRCWGALPLSWQQDPELHLSREKPPRY